MGNSSPQLQASIDFVRQRTGDTRDALYRYSNHGNGSGDQHHDLQQRRDADEQPA